MRIWNGFSLATISNAARFQVELSIYVMTDGLWNCWIFSTCILCVSSNYSPYIDGYISAKDTNTYIVRPTRALFIALLGSFVWKLFFRYIYSDKFEKKNTFGTCHNLMSILTYKTCPVSTMAWNQWNNFTCLVLHFVDIWENKRTRLPAHMKSRFSVRCRQIFVSTWSACLASLPPMLWHFMCLRFEIDLHADL